MTELPGTAWLAIPDYQYELFGELSIDPARLTQNAKSGKGVSVWGDLIYREGPAPQTFWHRNILSKPFTAEFYPTIREAADILRGIQRNWAHYPVACFRRAELIKEKLPFINEKPRPFPYSVPRTPMGMWSLLDEHTLFASAVTLKSLSLRYHQVRGRPRKSSEPGIPQNVRSARMGRLLCRGSG